MQDLVPEFRGEDGDLGAALWFVLCDCYAAGKDGRVLSLKQNGLFVKIFGGEVEDLQGSRLPKQEVHRQTPRRSPKSENFSPKEFEDP